MGHNDNEHLDIQARLENIENKLNILQTKPVVSGWMKFMVGFSVVFIIILIVYGILSITNILPLQEKAI